MRQTDTVIKDHMWTNTNIWTASWQNQQNDCAPSEDWDQPWHLPSLIRVFAVGMKKAWVLSYPLSAWRRLWSDWADAQADLSLSWAHMPFCWFCHEAAHSNFHGWYWKTVGSVLTHKTICFSVFSFMPPGYHIIHWIISLHPMWLWLLLAELNILPVVPCRNNNQY